MTGRNYGDDGGSSVVANECTITANGYYTCTKTGNYQITCVGGGGGGGCGPSRWLYEDPEDESDNYWCWMHASAGGSGYSNTKSLYLNKDQTYYVTIGAGGAQGKVTSGSVTSHPGTGGTTSFANLMSAIGGNGGMCVYYGCGEEREYIIPGGIGYNNGMNGMAYDAIAIHNNMKNKVYGGYLYYNGTLVSNTQVTGTSRLYRGDGGNAKWNNTTGYNGNAGCVIIKFIS